MYNPNKVRQQQQELVKAGYNIAVDGELKVNRHGKITSQKGISRLVKTLVKILIYLLI